MSVIIQINLKVNNFIKKNKEIYHASIICGLSNIFLKQINITKERSIPRNKI